MTAAADRANGILQEAGDLRASKISDGDLSDVTGAKERLESAQQALADAELEYNYSLLVIRRKYQLNPTDTVKLDTGGIVRS